MTCSGCRLPRRQGFTLLEILVVMFILGVIASVAVLAVGGGTSRQFEQEARRLVELAGLARDESLLTGQARALGFSKNGYAFLEQVFVDDASVTWVPREEPPLHARSLERLGLELRLWQGGKRVALDERADRAQVLFNGAGEVTPFELEVRPSAAGAAVLRVTGRRDGRVFWETVR